MVVIKPKDRNMQGKLPEQMKPMKQAFKLPEMKRRDCLSAGLSLACDVKALALSASSRWSLSSEVSVLLLAWEEELRPSLEAFLGGILTGGVEEDFRVVKVMKRANRSLAESLNSFSRQGGTPPKDLGDSLLDVQVAKRRTADGRHTQRKATDERLPRQHTTDVDGRP
ncbi:unnamed protein product [Darwinula stevensoni]|uniref:Uncharacterized protein n=1 Tax=Darwinula stevensoni TaxID=69355 RepID=A0A7R9AF12_9CRUS|nr:unnamed protein product [Darwinula stevensoni]CAG0902853.1 unnamed protein product [Darwinula stevensoni]